MHRFEKIAARWPELWQCLANAKRQGRLGHAFLVSSDLPETREEFALALAALAACPDADASGNPCGVCHACRQLEEGSYPELYELHPIGKMYQIQIGDRQSPEPNTVRYFEEQFFLTSTSGASRKVGIIHDADRMNSESQNALLKTLEEPPRETLIVLTTGNPAALLPTTRSRCQHLQLLENRVIFDFPGHEELFGALTDLFLRAPGNLIEAEKAAGTIIAVAGSLRGGSEEQAAEEWNERIFRAAELDPAYAKRMEKQQEDSANGAYMAMRKDFLAAIHTFAAQLYLLGSGVPRETLANPEIMAKLPLDAVIDSARAARMVGCADDLLFNLRFNVNESLALRNFAMQSALL